jgi:predicted P-loop ATPase/GTPase
MSQVETREYKTPAYVRNAKYNYVKRRIEKDPEYGIILSQKAQLRSKQRNTNRNLNIANQIIETFVEPVVIQLINKQGLNTELQDKNKVVIQLISDVKSSMQCYIQESAIKGLRLHTLACVCVVNVLSSYQKVPVLNTITNTQISELFGITKQTIINAIAKLC